MQCNWTKEKTIKYGFTALLSAIVIVATTANASQITIPKMHQYFGETPPNKTPKLFNPPLVSPDERFEGGTFSPDIKSFYFSRMHGKYKKRAFFVVKYEGNRWGEPQRTTIQWPQFSPDGSIMYQGKQYRQQTSDGWSELKKSDAPLDRQAHGISVSSSGTLFFPVFKKEDNGRGYLSFSALVNGEYQPPIKLNSDINRGDYIAHPYIAPDESYLMWDVERKNGYGQGDIYISFKQDDGTWSPATNMGPAINTDKQESSPIITHDGRYLFFSRGEWQPQQDGSQKWVGKSYWIDAQIINTLRPNE